MRSGRHAELSGDSVPMLSVNSEDVQPRHNSALMKGWTAETKSAIEAVTFIAAHLKNEDDYAEVTAPVYMRCRVAAICMYSAVMCMCTHLDHRTC